VDKSVNMLAAGSIRHSRTEAKNAAAHFFTDEAY
jgi:hypothetical protein